MIWVIPDILGSLCLWQCFLCLSHNIFSFLAFIQTFSLFFSIYFSFSAVSVSFFLVSPIYFSFSAGESARVAGDEHTTHRTAQGEQVNVQKVSSHPQRCRHHFLLTIITSHVCSLTKQLTQPNATHKSYANPALPATQQNITIFRCRSVTASLDVLDIMIINMIVVTILVFLTIDISSFTSVVPLVSWKRFSFNLFPLTVQ